MAMIHVLYNGRTVDKTFEEVFTPQRRELVGIGINVDVNASNITEAQLKRALADFLDVNQAEFGDFYAEMNPNGNATLRPNTTFGV